MARIQTFPKSRLKLDDKLILFSDVVKEYLPIGLELYDRNGLLIDANKAEMEIMGVVDLNEALGISLFENPNFSDKIIDDINFNEYGMIVLPGGPGTDNYKKSELLLEKVREFSENGKVEIGRAHV